MRRTLKILHEVGTVGIMGAIAAILVLLATSHDAPPAEYAAVRRGIDAIARIVVVPSLGLVLVTGLLAIGVHRPYHNAGWAWIKAVLGVSMLEGTLGGIAGTARDAAKISADVVAGTAEASQLASVLRQEWGVLWVILFVSGVNIVLGVWRPKLSRRKPAPRQARPQELPREVAGHEERERDPAEGHAQGQA